MSKKIEASPMDSDSGYQNPFKNSHWWENDRPPEGEHTIENITDDLLNELTTRLASGENIIELKPVSTEPRKIPIKKENNRTWQPDPAWHEPIIPLVTQGIIHELEDILEQSNQKFPVDFLPFLAQDCRHFWPDFQTTLNAIANSAFAFELIDKNLGDGESIYDFSAWNYFKGLWGDFGVVILLAYLCKRDDYLVIHADKLSLALDSVIDDYVLTEPVLPLNGLITNPTNKKSIRLEIESFEGGDEFWINVDPLASFGQFPDWEDRFSTENLTPLLPIHSLLLSVAVDDTLQNSQATFETSLRFELKYSNEPPILVESEQCNYSCDTGLTAKQILTFFRIFQSSTVRHSLIRTEVQE